LRLDAPAALDAAVHKGLSRDPAGRFPTAYALAVALEQSVRPASAREIGEWVEASAAATLTLRSERVARIEARSSLRGSLAESGGSSAASSSAAARDAEPHTTASHVAAASGSLRARRVPLLLGATAVLVVIAAGVLVTQRRQEPSPAPAPVEREVTATVPVVVEPAASLAAPGVPSASASSAARSSARTLAPPTPASPPARPARVDCAVPYTIDEGGVRHWKKGC
jgi:serine/threonine-protein kinase